MLYKCGSELFRKRWNVVEAPENLVKELLNLEVYVYQPEDCSRLEDCNLYYEPVSKLLQYQKLEGSDNWLLYYSDLISEKLREAVNADRIGKDPQLVVKFLYGRRRYL